MTVGPDNHSSFRWIGTVGSVNLVSMNPYSVTQSTMMKSFVRLIVSYVFNWFFSYFF